MNWKNKITWIGLLMTTTSLLKAAENAPLKVLVHDYAGASPRVLARAISTASELLSRAGVRTKWLPCDPATNHEADSPCRQIAEIQLRIVTSKMANNIDCGRKCLGYAVPTGRSGSIAGVNFHEALELKKLGVATVSQILGAAMAHEIGHLLRAQVGHSESGLMRASWDRPELKHLTTGHLVFSPAQAERMAATVAQWNRARVEREMVAIERR